MIGENFKRLNRNTNIKSLKGKIQNLKDQCGELYRECKNTGNFDSVKHDKLSKEIESLEYSLWGLTK